MLLKRFSYQIGLNSNKIQPIQIEVAPTGLGHLFHTPSCKSMAPPELHATL